MSQAAATAKRYGASGTFTAEQFAVLVEAADGRCYYCGDHPERLTCDHMTPFRRGGSNDIENIVPACLHCNASKKALTADEYLTKLGLLPLPEAAERA